MPMIPKHLCTPPSHPPIPKTPPSTPTTHLRPPGPSTLLQPAKSGTLRLITVIEAVIISVCAAVDAAQGSTRYTDAFVAGTRPKHKAPQVVSATTSAHSPPQPRFRTIGEMLEYFGLTPDEITLDALSQFTMTALAETCGTKASPLEAVLRLMNTDAQASAHGPSTTTLLHTYGATGRTTGHAVVATPDLALSADILLPPDGASAGSGACMPPPATNAQSPTTPPPPPYTPPPLSPDTPPPPAFPPPPGHVSAIIPPPPTTSHGRDGHFSFDVQSGR